MAEKVSLRERKKRERNKRIFAAGARLFKEKGFADVTISDIAGEADVGAGTIYNYFSSKNDILLSIVAEMCVEKKPEEKIYADDPVRTLVSYLGAYLDEFATLDKEIWCGWFSALFSQERHLIERGFELDMKIVGELSGVCEKMQKKKMISTETPAREIAMAVYTSFTTYMMLYLMLPEMDVETAKQEFEKNVKLLHRGFGRKKVSYSDL